MAETLQHADAPEASTAAGTILAVRNLTKRFGGLLAVSNIDLDLPKGKVLALIGPNGAGKSTTVNLLTGVLSPTEGSVKLDGHELKGLSSGAIARAGLARTFQNGRLFTRLSVLQNVVIAAGGRSTTHFADAIFRTARFGREERETEAEALDLLRGLSLDGDADRAVGELPYGKQRKLEIARALIMRPSVLLLDEPAAGLNSGEVEDLIAYINRLRAGGLSILLIEHNMGLVMRLADRVAVLNFGVKIADGTPAEIRNDENVIEAYLGRRSRDAAV